MTYHVLIDGAYTTLTYDCCSRARGYQYLTPGATSSHAFNSTLQYGQSFVTNGHHYEVLSGPPESCPNCSELVAERLKHWDDNLGCWQCKKAP